MVKLIKTSILINIIMLVTGCASMMKNSISFAIHYDSGKFIYKNNWPLCGNFYDSDGNMPVKRKTKYLTTDSSCKVSPEGYVPEQIIIEYAPWLTYEEQIKKGYGVPEELRYADGEEAETKRLAIKATQQEGITKIPATAWKQIVLIPPKEVEKYKYQVPEGKGNRSRGKEIHYLISLNPDGSYSIETKLYWVQKYRKNWN
ncbi:hypothetical protein E0H85_03830 [Acinetobacter terrae]|uniref:Lipoprotein n=2 Tax=Acinetobacter terrae TaxID=2731247 RepID=A0A4R0EP83_9GAMM|nr:hypothetical protein E0H85_03830 [Acinetobacter terrae]